MRIELTFKGNVPTLNGGEGNGLIRMHWRKKTQLSIRYQNEAMSQTRHKFTGPVTLELIRYKSAGPPNDQPNLVSSEKIPVDSIVRAGILPDDKDTIIVSRKYREEHCKRGEQRTVIILEDAQESGSDNPAT